MKHLGVIRLDVFQTLCAQLSVGGVITLRKAVRDRLLLSRKVGPFVCHLSRSVCSLPPGKRPLPALCFQRDTRSSSLTAGHWPAAVQLRSPITQKANLDKLCLDPVQRDSRKAVDGGFHSGNAPLPLPASSLLLEKKKCLVLIVSVFKTAKTALLA